MRRNEQLELGTTNTAPALTEPTRNPDLRVVGLFAGIGGVELGLSAAGHGAVLFSELDPFAGAVLKAHFPDVEIVPDVRDVRTLPPCDLVAAGFPCQDLSQAGRTAGIGGARSGLVGEVLRLVRDHDPKWLVLENVPFMLALDGGRGMTVLTHWLNQLGFRWAYRVVDTRAFGLPQRRRRVILLASRSEDPRDVLFVDDAGVRDPSSEAPSAYGFYWTEGSRGLGWAEDAVPTLKAGSTIGIPSPPAVWVPSTGVVGTPDIRDAERLQGFPVDWTAPAMNVTGSRQGTRWRLVGNAVSVPVTRWLGSRLSAPAVYDSTFDPPLRSKQKWPNAAWSLGGDIHVATVSEWPLDVPSSSLVEFLENPLRPLSSRAASGFHRRAAASTLNFAPGFLDAVERHLETMSATAV